ncbi:MAG: PKD domain-containing protein [Candidatus Levybacteria bacterium]|nr:PKD domain-containing protein [Candidatus Levybacteria bacterium]
MQLLFIISLLILIFSSTSLVFASHTFTVTSFDGQKNFLWSGGPTSGCSAINSYVMTYPGNDQQSKLFTCEETFGSSDNSIPDGEYYIFLAVGGHGWKSQVFTINDGAFTQPTPTETPSPTPTIINQPPTAIAGTSLDENGDIQLDASLSSDPENDALTYTWYVPDEGNIKTGQKVLLTDISSGTYTITLVVNDNLNQSTDSIKIGIVSRKPIETVNMKIKDVSINKRNGDFTIKGNLDVRNPLFKNLMQSPIGKMTLELQTGGTAIAPIYGIAGEDMFSLKTKNSYAETE